MKPLVDSVDCPWTVGCQSWRHGIKCLPSTSRDIPPYLQLSSITFRKCGEHGIACVLCPGQTFGAVISLKDCSVFWAIFLANGVNTPCCPVLWKGDTLSGIPNLLPLAVSQLKSKNYTFITCAFLNLFMTCLRDCGVCIRVHFNCSSRCLEGEGTISSREANRWEVETQLSYSCGGGGKHGGHSRALSTERHQL